MFVRDSVILKSSRRNTSHLQSLPVALATAVQVTPSNALQTKQFLISLIKAAINKSLQNSISSYVHSHVILLKQYLLSLYQTHTIHQFFSSIFHCFPLNW